MSVEQRTAIKSCVLNGKKTEKKLWECWSRLTAMLQRGERHCISGTRGMKTDKIV